jgi:hypothetical protein
MNITPSILTGELAERAVATLFTSWSWTVGKDFVDTGYDLSVEPDTARFQGRRFLVQVKGTSRNHRGRVTASVSKQRLRQYAINPLPVFLVRSTAEGKLHWLHVQPWAKQNVRKLQGSGDARVALPHDQTLQDKDGFVACLAEILKPMAERRGAVADLAKERGRYLSSFDPRFGVRVGLRGGAESYEVFAQSSSATFGVELRPATDPSNIENLKDAIRYGLPATLDVDSLRMTGSELFPALGVGEIRQGRFSLNPTKHEDGTVRLYPGTSHSILAPELVLPARLYRGHEGFAVSNEALESLYDFKIRGEPGQDGGIKLRINASFRATKLSQLAIAQFGELATLGDWAEQVLGQKSMYLDFRFSGRRMAFSVQGERFESIRDVVRYAFVIGRLHKVAKALDSALKVDDAFALSNEDVSSIHLAHALLKGERLSATLEPIEFEAISPPQFGAREDFHVRTSLVFELSNQVLGTITAAMDLANFAVEALPESSRFRLTQDQDSSVWLYYSDHTQPEKADTTSVYSRPSSMGEIVIRSVDV